MIEYRCGKCGAKMASPDSMAGGTDACPNCGTANQVPPAAWSDATDASGGTDLHFASPQDTPGAQPPSVSDEVVLTPVGQAPPGRAAPARPGAASFFTVARIIAGSAAVLVLLASALPWVWRPETTFAEKLASSVAEALGAPAGEAGPPEYKVWPFQLANVVLALILGGAVFLPGRLQRAAAWWSAACVAGCVIVYLLWDHGIQMQVWGKEGLGVEAGLFVAVAGYLAACVAAGWEAGSERRFWFVAPVGAAAVGVLALVLFTGIFGTKSYRVALKEGSSQVASAWGGEPTATVSIAVENTGWNTLRLAPAERIQGKPSGVAAIRMYQKREGTWQVQDASKVVSFAPRLEMPDLSDPLGLARKKKTLPFAALSVPPRTTQNLRLRFRPAWEPDVHVRQACGGEWAMELRRVTNDATLARIEFRVPGKPHPDTEFLAKLADARRLHRSGDVAAAWDAVRDLRPPRSVSAQGRSEMESLRGEIWQAQMGRICDLADAAWAPLRAAKPTAAQIQGVLDILQGAGTLLGAPEARKSENRALCRRLADLKKQIESVTEAEGLIAQIDSLIRGGQLAEAQRQLDRLTARFPRHKTAADRLTTQLDEAKKIASEKDRKELIARIESLVKAEQLDEAKTALARFERDHASDTVNVQRLRGLVGALEKTLRDRERKKRVASIDSLLKSGQLTDASGELTRFEASYPQERDTIAALGKRLMAQGRTEIAKLLAAKQYTKGVQLIRAVAPHDKQGAHLPELGRQAYRCALSLMALKEPVEQVRDAETLARKLHPEIATEQSWPEVRAYIEGVAPQPVWPVAGWKDTTFKKGHALTQSCPVLKRIEKGKAAALAGLDFGPPAKDKTDPAYVQFRDKHFKAFESAVAEDRSLKKPSRTTNTYGGLVYERINVPRGGKGATAMVTIKDGRCVAFWFLGDNPCFGDFLQALPLAKLGYPARAVPPSPAPGAKPPGPAEAPPGTRPPRLRR